MNRGGEGPRGRRIAQEGQRNEATRSARGTTGTDFGASKESVLRLGGGAWGSVWAPCGAPWVARGPLLSPRGSKSGFRRSGSHTRAPFWSSRGGFGEPFWSRFGVSLGVFSPDFGSQVFYEFWVNFGPVLGAKMDPKIEHFRKKMRSGSESGTLDF